MSNTRSNRVAIQADRQLLTRDQAGEFLLERYGNGSRARLAVLAVTGEGPAYRRFNNRAVYEIADLVAWAESRLSEKAKSTSELPKIKKVAPENLQPKRAASG